jgi:hypothetical protein
LSFFDEPDEPRAAPRTRRPSGTGRRPPSDQQAIRVRQAVAVVAILVVLILMILGIHSCQVSSANNALKTYSTDVASLIQQSDQTGSRLFALLKAGTASAHEQTLQTSLYTLKGSAESQLQTAQGLSVPGPVTAAQQQFVVTMSLRANGIADIAANIQTALSHATAQQGVNAIAVDMQKFLASDVNYTLYTAPGIAGALHSAGLPVAGAIKATNFFPDIAWLSPTYIASQLGASVAAATNGGSPCPANTACGHQLVSVSVGGVTLSTGGGNTIPASPAPTFTATFMNTGQNTETGVTVKATITTSSGTTITAQDVVPVTKPGHTYTAPIKLSQPPPTGTAQVTVTVERVPGEGSVVRNTQVFPVTFS